jgi:SH3 and multiple ankyrin repeat domains protein
VQACRNGLVHHLEHLLVYGADMDSKNASGNTPLHVCAVNNQEACARMLLFRGANRGALNYANQTPYQVNQLIESRFLTFSHVVIQFECE